MIISDACGRTSRVSLPSDIVFYFLHSGAAEEETEVFGFDFERDTFRKLFMLSEKQQSAFLLSIHLLPAFSRVMPVGSNDEIGIFGAVALDRNPHSRHYHLDCSQKALVCAWHPDMRWAKQVEQTDRHSGPA